jgi:alanine racemase
MADIGNSTGALLTIDLDAIWRNYRQLRARAGKAACAAVLKADAYGLGASHVAPVLAAEGCRHFFVAHLDEAIVLRKLVPASADIFVLHGVMPGTESEFLHHRIIPVLNSAFHIRTWQALAQRVGRTLPAIVQFDTGMSRLGLSPGETDEWLADAQCLQGISLRYVMSHLACAERQQHPMNTAQLKAFNTVRSRLPGVSACFANSSGIFLGPDFHFELVRPGAALFGVAPVAGEDNPLHPVVRLQARIIQTRAIQAGDRVGYGLTWRAPSPRLLATIAVGYADGWLRSFSNSGCADIGGIQAPIVGRVSMDTCTIDVSDVDPALLQPGAFVDLISARQTIDTVAAAAGTIAYEILTSLGQRYQRRYTGGKGGSDAGGGHAVNEPAFHALSDSALNI